uniref:HMG box domain-containing protein n=1 Tax=Odontella aurita TaxID=265563 RepID=A0A7S4JYU2_9STRA|mmetsp:Transcript_56811/g.169623  ORF Transcript_56811/g.169623 Transcript_56811/m.169623 type:complete len:341 (+) Transcript_56811:130-1152(+)
MVKNASRDPNAPKRNLTAFFLYQNAMRDTLRERNPGMSFGHLAKYCAAMYEEMSHEEKEGWAARAAADKQRYLNEMAGYEPPPGFDANGHATEASVPAGRISVGGARRPKNAKDENAPTRNVSAYLLYQNAMREQFQVENPGLTFGQLEKYTSHMYNHLTKEEMKIWEARAADDKARFDHEIAHYDPPPGYDAVGKSIEEAHRPRKKSKKAPKDPNAPKRVSGAFVFFSQEMRPKLKIQYPGIRFVEMGRLMGERWRSLTDEGKLRYENLAAEDKVRYDREIDAYKKTKQQEAEVGPPQQSEVNATATEHSNKNHVEPGSEAIPPYHGSADVKVNVYAQH